LGGKNPWIGYIILGPSLREGKVWEGGFGKEVIYTVNLIGLVKREVGTKIYLKPNYLLWWYLGTNLPNYS